MFPLTLIDHLRVTFGHVVYRHKTHALVAQSRARWSRRLRVLEVVSVLGVAFTAIGVAFGRGPVFAGVCAALAAVAAVLLVLHVTLDLDESARVHAACASQLWQMREKYCALLSDLADGALDLDEVRRRRDALMAAMHAIYENAPPADHPAYQAAARAIRSADDTTLSDEDIDMFLPKSLHKSGSSAAA